MRLIFGLGLVIADEFFLSLDAPKRLVKYKQSYKGFGMTHSVILISRHVEPVMTSVRSKTSEAPVSRQRCLGKHPYIDKQQPRRSLGWK